MAGGLNVANQFQADVQQYIADETLPVARRQLVAYQAGEPLTLPKGMGTTYTATRFQRLPLPQYPLAEGVPPLGETMTIQQVTGVAQQWGDAVKITDQAEIQTKHPLFKKAMELVGLQIAETFDRNSFNMLMGLTQVNYVNSRGSRGALVAGDVLDTTTVLRTDAALETIGAPRFMGDEQTDTKLNANSSGGGTKADRDPRGAPHYIGITHTIPVADWSQNSTVVLARSYSAVNRLYNYEIGEWGGIRFVKSNMVPTFTGIANNGNGSAAVAQAGGGTLLTTNYFIIITGSDTANQYESQIYAVSGAIAVVAGGSIVVTTPNISGFTYNVYIGTTNTPTNLGATAAGPTVGPAQGQAVQLPPSTNVTITGIGIFQTPPARPATGVTVYPTFIIGRGLYGQVVLDNVKYAYLKDADKFDYLNQQRIVSWKAYWGGMILNQQFGARIEHTSAFSAAFG
jgi:N4-gp56 family major capsid protein